MRQVLGSLSYWIRTLTLAFVGIVLGIIGLFLMAEISSGAILLWL